MSFVNAVQTYNRKKQYKKKTANPSLVEDYYNMSRVFKQNSWDNYPGSSAIFNAHVGLMRRLDDEEKRLYLELTSKFLWIRDYTSLIISQLNNILDSYKSYTTFYVLRCMPQKDQKWSKSSGVVLYEIRNPEVRKQLSKSLIILDKIEEVKDIKNDGHTLLILVDDFVGTGDTAEKCIIDVRKFNATLLGYIVVMSVAALEKGKQKLSSFNVPIFSSYIIKRGISDYYTGYNLTKNIQLMHNIESKLRVSKSFSLGYGASEALICLKRCPNNTFPIYWHDSRYSPYPRY